MLIASQRQEGQRKRKSVMQIKVVEISPEIEPRRKLMGPGREFHNSFQSSLKGSQMDESVEPQEPMHELRRGPWN